MFNFREDTPTERRDELARIALDYRTDEIRKIKDENIAQRYEDLLDAKPWKRQEATIMRVALLQSIEDRRQDPANRWPFIDIHFEKGAALDCFMLAYAENGGNADQAYEMTRRRMCLSATMEEVFGGDLDNEPPAPTI
jgi:hypothetical protein